MKNNKVYIFTLIGITIISLCFSTYVFFGQKKQAFFDYNEVYNNCDLKKSLETDLNMVVSQRKSHLDSIQVELSMLSSKVKAGTANPVELSDFETMKSRYLTYQNNYEDENIRLKEQYFTQIRMHINEKARNYGELNGYNFLFAAVGDGSLMYGNEDDDVTKDFLDYVNKK